MRSPSLIAPPLVALLLALLGPRALPAADVLTFHQLLQRILDTHPTIQIAALQVRRAREEMPRAESRLGWTFTGFAGVSRDVSIVFAPTDRADAGAGLSRQLSSGGTIGLDATHFREDSTFVFSPAIPNPSHQTHLDLSYRQPLGKGTGNPQYTQGIVQAEAQLSAARATARALYDELATQGAELYYGAAGTLAALRSVERAIDRAQRLKRYVEDNARLGIAEDKDILQADAQLRSRIAERQALIALWQDQRTQLNRLMGSPFDAELTPLTREDGNAIDIPLAAQLPAAQAHSPDLERAQATLRLAEAQIALSRDTQRDTMDLVFSVGSRQRSGDAAAGNSFDESEAVGGIRFEYSRALDRRGVDAVLRQALLDRDIALEQIRTAQEDLRYRLAGVLREIESRRHAVRDNRAHIAAENAKLREGMRRYRQGRATTETLIQFENDLFAAELQLERQLIDLSRALTTRERLLGELWRDVRLPPADAAAFRPVNDRGAEPAP